MSPRVTTEIRRYGIIIALTALWTGVAAAQETLEVVELDGKEVPVIARVGGAFVVLTEGPGVPSSYGPLNESTRLNYRWYVVQDSSLGVVFRKRGGFKADGDGRLFDGDIDVLTTTGIEAVEFGVATFNVWDEYTGTWFVTDLRREDPDEKFDINPRVAPCRFSRESVSGFTCYSIRKHFSSIIYVSRVRYSDGSIVIADNAPVLEAAHTISLDVTVEDLEPEEPLLPQLPPEVVET